MIFFSISADEKGKSDDASLLAGAINPKLPNNFDLQKAYGAEIEDGTIKFVLDKQAFDAFRQRMTAALDATWRDAERLQKLGYMKIVDASGAKD